jgi:hypothetical protein
MEDLTLPSVGATFKKWGCCTPTLPKCHDVPHNSKRKQKKKSKKLKIVMRQWDRLVVARWPCTGPILFFLPPLSFLLPPPFFLLHPPLLDILVNSTSLAPTHARPAQTSPKNFKHP